MAIEITRPAKGDEEELRALFAAVIADAFLQDGIPDRTEAIAEEVEKQMSFLHDDFATDGASTHFLVAKDDGRIIGTVAHHDAAKNDMYALHLKKDPRGIPEVTTVYVLPQEQGRGIGSILFSAVLEKLRRGGATEYLLDGGYRKSQAFWIRKIGEPDVTLHDHWGKDLHHMLWRRAL